MAEQGSGTKRLYPVLGTEEIQTSLSTCEDDYMLPVATIEVRGFNPSTHDETLQLYFENTKRSNGDDIYKYNREEDAIYVTFKNESVANRVCQRKHVVDNTTLCVKRFIQTDVHQEKQPHDQENGTGNDINNTPTAPPEEGTIYEIPESVHTPPTESKNQFEHVQLIPPPEYKSLPPPYQSLPPQNDCGDQQPTDGYEETSHSSPPSLTYRDKVLIQGLNPNTSLECLFNFLEAKADISPVGTMYSEDVTAAVVSSGDIIDFGKLESACHQRSLEGHHLQVSKVEITNSVMVARVGEMSQDTLRYYFENARRSGGDNVEKMKLHDEEEDNIWLLYFQRSNVLAKVCGRRHTVDGQDIEVKMYYPSLGMPQFENKADAESYRKKKTIFNPPEPITVESSKNYKIQYLQRDSNMREDIEQKLAPLHAKIRWSTQIEESVVIRCTLTAEVSRSRRLAKTWTKDVLEYINHRLHEISEDKHVIKLELWKFFVEKLDACQISEKDRLSMIIIPEYHGVIVVGEADVVSRVSAHVRQVKEEALEIWNRNSNLKTKVIRAKSHQLHMLLQSDFPGKWQTKFEGFTIAINPSDNEVTMIGLESEIETALLDMYQLFENISRVCLGKVSNFKADFYKTEKVSKYLREKVENKNIAIYWALDDGLDVILYYLSDEDKEIGTLLLRESITEVSVCLDKESSALLQGRMRWEEMTREIENIAPGLVKVVSGYMDKDEIIVLSASEYEQYCRDKLERFFYSNTVYEKTLLLSPSEALYARQHFKKQLALIESSFSNRQVEIVLGQSEIRIKAIRLDLPGAENMIAELLRRIVSRQVVFKKRVAIKFLSSVTGQRLLKKTEKDKTCIIEVNVDAGTCSPKYPVQSSNDEETSVRSSNDVIASCVMNSGQRVSVVQVGLTKLDVDAIVITANKDLHLDAGLAKVIAREGGITIQKDCDDYIQRKGRPLRTGDVCCTNSGKLNCKLVFHAVGPKYQGEEEDEAILKEIIIKILGECNHRRMTSLAFPALCTGYNRFPGDIASKIITKSVWHYFRNNAKSTIRHVYLCDVKEQCVNCFKRELESVSRVSSVTMDTTRQRGMKEGTLTALSSRRKDHSRSTMQSSDHVVLVIGKIELNIYQGDITNAETDIIVTGTAENMDMSRGVISNKLLRKGGNKIQEELLSQKAAMEKDGMAVTTSGKGRLFCKYIMHVSITDGDETSNWRTKFKTIFKKTETLKLRSIAIPALGTGHGVEIAELAQSLYATLTQIGTSTHLAEVHIVIFEPVMKNEFLGEIGKCMNTKRERFKNVVSKVANHLRATVADQYRRPKSNSEVTVTVYADRNAVGDAVKTLKERIIKDIPTKVFTDGIIKEFTPTQQNCILSISEEFDVEVVYNNLSGKIKLIGNYQDLQKASDYVDTLISEAERNKQQKKVHIS